MSTWKTLSQKAIMAADDDNPLALVKPVNVTQELRRLRERANLSQTAMAAKLGYKGQSGYQRYEDATLYTKEYLRPEFVEELIPILLGKGDPAIAMNEILLLAGLPSMENKYISTPDETESGGLNAVLRIPILSWEQVKMWISGELNQAGIKKHTDASHQDADKTSFVLPILTNSMAPDDMRPGDKIVCDPTKPYYPSDIVLAEIASEPRPILGHYYLRKEVGGLKEIEIVPSNDAYPPHRIDKDHPGRIIGIIVEHRKALYRGR